MASCSASIAAEQICGASEPLSCANCLRVIVFLTFIVPLGMFGAVGSDDSDGASFWAGRHSPLSPPFLFAARAAAAGAAYYHFAVPNHRVINCWQVEPFVLAFGRESRGD